ncbi:haloacid dehalogenase type II [Kineococcus sp. SYSU DK004]|uniref:haloacid dehalogenase type II n=1 Tax=Kineococcus sp. SYSU DK004 TaxID=3383125 RepID=UPI003D7CE475
MPQPAVVVLDVNETLSDLSPLEGAFSDVGLSAADVPRWFTAVLRDGFALSTAGAAPRFGAVAEGVLRTLLPAPEGPGHEEAVHHVLDAVAALPPHPDVAEGVRALRAAGHRLLTLSNGPASTAERLLAEAGVGELVEATLSVEDVGPWKPAPATYRYAAERAGVPPSELVLVAVHPWDTDGAQRAGASGAWVDRAGRRWPAHLRAPDARVTGLPELPEALAALRGHRG